MTSQCRKDVSVQAKISSGFDQPCSLISTAAAAGVGGIGLHLPCDILLRWWTSISQTQQFDVDFRYWLQPKTERLSALKFITRTPFFVPQLVQAAVGGVGQISCSAAVFYGLWRIECRDIPARYTEGGGTRSLIVYAKPYWTNSTATLLKAKELTFLSKTWAISSKVKRTINCTGKEVGKPLADNSY